MKKQILKTISAFLVISLSAGGAYAQSWSLSGNTGSTNVLGQTDANGFSLITNNTARMTLTSGGNIGINITTPSSYKLHIHNTTADQHLLLSGSAPSLRFSDNSNPSLTQHKAALGYATGSGNYVDYSIIGDFIMQNSDTAADLIFANGYGTRSGSPRFGVEQMRISKEGYIGINTRAYAELNGATVAAITPKDRVDIYLNQSPIQEYVRIENMPIGHGQMVVIDSVTGRLYRVSGSYFRPAGNSAENNAQMAAMQDQINTLMNEIAALKRTIAATNAVPAGTQNTLEQNTPNPFSNSTQIKYNITSDFSSCSIIVYDVSGKKVYEHQVDSKGEGTFNFTSVQGGTYLYTLVIDGRNEISKKMVSL